MTQPLVSIAIVTYNSSKYIIDTLNSVKAQSYENIELIISDDCSPDNTVELCRNWLDANKDRFVRTKLITVDKNSGVTCNCNRAKAAAEGQWFKLLAGDDLMMPDCIKENVEFITANPKAKIIFSKTQLFTETEGKINLSDKFLPKPYTKEIFASSAEYQHDCLSQYNFLPAPSSFISEEIFRKHDYNETYPASEDWAYWFKLTGLGYKLYFFPSVTTLYRREESTTRSDKTFFNIRYKASDKLFYLLERKAHMEKVAPEAAIEEAVHYMMCDFAINVLKNKKNAFTKPVYRILYSLFKMIAKL